MSNTRMDEAGTPKCVTVDHQTLEDGTVTVRDRDTGNQKRIQPIHGKGLDDWSEADELFEL